MLSTLPENIVEQRIDNIINSVIFLLILVLSYGILLILFLLYMQGQQKKELERLAYQDFLTGEANYEAFKREFKRLKSRGGILIICDIVEFKLINRYFGARKGDEVLRELGKLFAEQDGFGKTVARVSDDQFIFFFPDMTAEEVPAK